MNWLNINLKMLRSREYIGSAPEERGTWLSVLGHSCDQENGGRIIGGASWKDRQWQQTCGVTLNEIRRAKRLLLIDGEDVVVFGYPSEKQAELEAKREAGRAGGLSSASSRASSRASSCGYSCASTEGEGEGEGEGERNENRNENRKEKEKEKEKDVGENETAADAATTSAELVLGDEAKAAKPEKQTDAQWIAGIKADPAFAGIDVEREHAKCLRWCSENGKQQTRRRFINWLNRCDRPIGAVVSAAQQRSEELSKVNGYEY